jgi:hypothetical protein
MGSEAKGVGAEGELETRPYFTNRPVGRPSILRVFRTFLYGVVD